MQKNKQQLIVGIGYYILAILVILFFYREESVASEFVQMICAVLFLFVLPMLLVIKTFDNKIIKKKGELSLTNCLSLSSEDGLKVYNWPTEFVKKQLIFSIVVVWGISLLFWGFMIQWGGESLVIWKNSGVVKLILMNLTIIPIGLLAQEFFFRGFLLKIFRDNFGKWISVGAVAVLAGVFSMILTKSIFGWQILLGIFLVNIGLGWIVLKFKSVVFSFFVYWLVLVGLNFWALYQFSQGIK